MVGHGPGTGGWVQLPGEGGPETSLWDQVQPVDTWPEGGPRGPGDTSRVSLVAPQPHGPRNSPAACGSSSLRAEWVGGAGGEERVQGLHPGSPVHGGLSVCGQPRVPLPTLSLCSQDTPEVSAIVSSGLPRCGGWTRPPARHRGPAPRADGRLGLLPPALPARAVADHPQGRARG